METVSQQAAGLGVPADCTALQRFNQELGGQIQLVLGKKRGAADVHTDVIQYATCTAKPYSKAFFPAAE
ncbi:hypothetical protein D3C80_2131120 [compost metagenome]